MWTLSVSQPRHQATAESTKAAIRCVSPGSILLRKPVLRGPARCLLPTQYHAEGQVSLEASSLTLPSLDSQKTHQGNTPMYEKQRGLITNCQNVLKPYSCLPRYKSRDACENLPGRASHIATAQKSFVNLLYPTNTKNLFSPQVRLSA